MEKQDDYDIIDLFGHQYKYTIAIIVINYYMLYFKCLIYISEMRLHMRNVHKLKDNTNKRSSKKKKKKACKIKW